MMQHRLIWITWLALLLPGAAAQATVMMPLDTRALTERADRVVLGSVESTESHWTSDHNAIYTDVTLRVTRVYKGTLQAGQTLVVRREGGTVDGIGMKVYGAPNFGVGEEVLVFLEKRGQATYTVGMTQGKLRVDTATDGSKQVHADLSAVAFTKAAPRSLFAIRRLDDLEREIRSYVRSAR
jgi:hypothetical protein